MREISLSIMDIAQNSIAAQATLIEIYVHEISAEDKLVVQVKDNGRGMSAEVAKKVLSPFYTTRKSRSVGLGLPLLKMACELTGGSLTLESCPQKGTLITANFTAGHIDTPPLGDIADTIRLLITCNPGIDFIYHRTSRKIFYCVDTRNIKKLLGNNISFADPELSLWLKDYIERLDSGLPDDLPTEPANAGEPKFT